MKTETLAVSELVTYTGRAPASGDVESATAGLAAATAAIVRQHAPTMLPIVLVRTLFLPVRRGPRAEPPAGATLGTAAEAGLKHC